MSKVEKQQWFRWQFVDETCYTRTPQWTRKDRTPHELPLRADFEAVYYAEQEYVHPVTQLPINGVLRLTEQQRLSNLHGWQGGKTVGLNRQYYLIPEGLRWSPDSKEFGLAAYGFMEVMYDYREDGKWYAWLMAFHFADALLIYVRKGGTDPKTGILAGGRLTKDIPQTNTPLPLLPEGIGVPEKINVLGEAIESKPYQRGIVRLLA